MVGMMKKNLGTSYLGYSMILYLGKTERGQLVVECSTPIVGREACFVLIDKPDSIAEDSKIIGQYRNLEEVKKAAIKYLEEEIPF